MITSGRKKLEIRIRSFLLGLPGVNAGKRFGREAFFYRKRFFCHFHPAGTSFFLETYVWNKVDKVVREMPGVIPHPEYGASGWVRLSIDSDTDFVQAQRLVESTYRYLRTIKRIAVRKDRFTPELLSRAKETLPQVRFELKQAQKTIQVIMETPEMHDYDKAGELLDKATKIMKINRQVA